MKNIAFIPARGGSVSIPRKNMASVGHLSLLDYVCNAACESKCIDEVYLSTDDDFILGYVEVVYPHIIILDRPPHLTDGLSYKIQEVVLHHVNNGDMAIGRDDILTLFQPTSPFVKQTHIEALDMIMRTKERYASAQTICPVPHNSHAINQRVYEKGSVAFKYKEERMEQYNKQKKENLYTFGNLVSTRMSVLYKTGEFFAEPSYGYIIGRDDAIDVDGPDDLIQANRIVNDD